MANAWMVAVLCSQVCSKHKASPNLSAWCREGGKGVCTAKMLVFINRLRWMKRGRKEATTAGESNPFGPWGRCSVVRCDCVQFNGSKAKIETIYKKKENKSEKCMRVLCLFLYVCMCVRVRVCVGQAVQRVGVPGVVTKGVMFKFILIESLFLIE